MLAKKTSKNQLTLPKEIVKEFPGVDYFDAKVNPRDSAYPGENHTDGQGH